MSLPVHQLSGRAARFALMLRDFGHVDDEGVNRLLLGSADLRGPGAGGPVDLDEVRRAAAILLFPDVGSEPGSVLDQDWPILFS